MEARLYAEDPAKGFLPSIGMFELLRFGEGEGRRVDTGVCQGGEVSPFYDPMIAKLIARGDDRDQARKRLGRILAGTAVWPVKTNAPFLVKALEHPAFVAGDIDTGLIGRDGEVMGAPPTPSPEALRRAAMALVPQADQPGFRLNAAPVRSAFFLLDGNPVETKLEGQGCDKPAASALVTDQGQAWLLTPWRKDGSTGGVASSGVILSPMPGRVIAVAVAAGDRVVRGQKLLTLEAMKMEHSLTAPFDGVVAELNAAPGAQVQVEAVLARIEKDDI
jgi:3-methylcrotonyl-CoA carboxylase alpha subunit